MIFPVRFLLSLFRHALKGPAPMVTTPPSPGAPTPPNEPSATSGPVVNFECSVTPGDLAQVQRTKRGAVQVGVREGGDHARVALSPAEARRMAAAILNAADEAEGVVPLAFLPRALDLDSDPR